MKKVFSLLAIAAMVLGVSCKKGGTDPTPTPGPEPEPAGLSIIIDGNFDDWATLDMGNYNSAKNNPASPWDGVSEIRCCADADFVYYYIKYNKATLDELMAEKDELPIRLCINTDGEFTSGYDSYFLEAYDFIVEGGLSNAEGAWGEINGTLYQRVDGSWSKLIPETGGVVMGKGSGTEYEIMLSRELFNNAVSADQKMGDIFYTGIRFYTTYTGSWEELSNMPNSSIDEGDGNGWGHLLMIQTVK